MTDRLRIYRPDEPEDDRNALVETRFNIIKKEYWRTRAIFSELGQSDTVLKRALKEGHGIDPEQLTPDTMLYFTYSTQQKEGFEKAGIKAPTFLQILGSSEVVALTEADAIEKFKALKRE